MSLWVAVLATTHLSGLLLFQPCLPARMLHVWWSSPVLLMLLLWMQTGWQLQRHWPVCGDPG